MWIKKEMFYLMTHSTHFIYSYMASDMVKDHSDSKRENPLPPHRLLFRISSKVQTGQHIPHPLLHQSWNTGLNEKQLYGSTMRDQSDNPLNHERTFYHRATSRFRHELFQLVVLTIRELITIILLLNTVGSVCFWNQSVYPIMFNNSNIVIN